MKKSTKAWLITAGSLVLLGCIIFVCTMSVLKWDFQKLSTVKYETNTYDVTDAFNDISLTTDTADIIFALSGDGKCRVECYEEENAKHSVTVENNELVVKINEQKSWYDYIGFYLGSPKITVYLPKAEYGVLTINESTGSIKAPKDLSFKSADISVSTGDIDFFAASQEAVKIKTSTGNICIENNTVGSLDLSVTTGKATVSGVTCNGGITVGVSTGKAALTDIACKSVTSSGSTGDIYLKNVVAAEKLSIERSTGNVKFDRSDAAEIFVKTNTGNVTGSLLTDKVFITQTDTGDVSVPKTVTGGRCEIKTDTGDIKIKKD